MFYKILYGFVTESIGVEYSKIFVCTIGGRCCNCSGSVPPLDSQEYDDPDVATEANIVKEQKENGYKVVWSFLLSFGAHLVIISDSDTRKPTILSFHDVYVVEISR